MNKIQTETKIKNSSLNYMESNKARKKRLNLKLLNRVLSFILIIIGVYYVAGANDLSIKGFVLQQLKKETREMRNANESLQIKITALESYSNISQKVGKLSMVPSGNIKYIAAQSGAVAMK